MTAPATRLPILLSCKVTASSISHHSADASVATPVFAAERDSSLAWRAMQSLKSQVPTRFCFLSPLKEGERYDINSPILPTTRLSAIGLSSVACIASAARGSAEADYPDKPIRLMVVLPPADQQTRSRGYWADELSKSLGKPIIIENAAGAGGNIATDRVVKSAPDGYTLLLAASGMIVVNPSLYQNLAFDTVKDLAPISQVCVQPNILVIMPTCPREAYRSLSRSLAQLQANLLLPLVAPAPPSILPASCSSRPPASISGMLLPEHRPGCAGPTDWPGDHGLRWVHGSAAAGAGGQVAGVGRHLSTALACGTRRPDDGGIRLPRH